jgi:hypothetical protein
LRSSEDRRQIDVGTKSIGQRPELEAMIAQCLMCWSHIEAEMALVLGQLLGAQNAVALAVFQSLRQSRTQREVISAAAKVALNETDQTLLAAILSVHNSIEKERNNLAHGHFGTSTKVMDGILWMHTNSYVAIRANITLAERPQWDDARHHELLSSIWVYKIEDLTKISDDMKTLAVVWYDFIAYLRAVVGSRRYIQKLTPILSTALWKLLNDL